MCWPVSITNPFRRHLSVRRVEAGNQSTASPDSEESRDRTDLSLHSHHATEREAHIGLMHRMMLVCTIRLLHDEDEVEARRGICTCYLVRITPHGEARAWCPFTILVSEEWARRLHSTSLRKLAGDHNGFALRVVWTDIASG